MRDNLKRFVRDVTTAIPLSEPIVEIGALQVPGQEGYADLRPFFVGKAYIGCDLRPGPGVDRLEDAEHLTFADASVGTVLMLDTLEHVQNCQMAMAEVYRVLQPGGVVLISSWMLFPIHAYPDDYWRFTPSAFHLLLRDFPTRLVFTQGFPRLPHTLLGVGIKAQWPEEQQQALYQQLAARHQSSRGDITLISPLGFQPLTLEALLAAGGRLVNRLTTRLVGRPVVPAIFPDRRDRL